ncbi:hypothetical protein ACETIH_03085 [Microvirga arabica]|uniref:Uncharacterized protein n=1 Tax=Microvirga arabica TaxID=1128671 RepID=A0ABV6Y363_9HYPH
MADLLPDFIEFSPCFGKIVLSLLACRFSASCDVFINGNGCPQPFQPSHVGLSSGSLLEHYGQVTLGFREGFFRVQPGGLGLPRCGIVNLHRSALALKPGELGLCVDQLALKATQIRLDLDQGVFRLRTSCRSALRSGFISSRRNTLLLEPRNLGLGIRQLTQKAAQVSLSLCKSLLGFETGSIRPFCRGIAAGCSSDLCPNGIQLRICGLELDAEAGELRSLVLSLFGDSVSLGPDLDRVGGGLLGIPKLLPCRFPLCLNPADRSPKLFALIAQVGNVSGEFLSHFANSCFLGPSCRNLRLDPLQFCLSLGQFSLRLLPVTEPLVPVRLHPSCIGCSLLRIVGLTLRLGFTGF